MAQPKDPWAHRSEGMRCATCMWSVAKGGCTLGRCRRHAPTMNGYPVIVMDEDWCGDHKLDEAKVEAEPRVLTMEEFLAGEDGILVVQVPEGWSFGIGDIPPGTVQKDKSELSSDDV